ncbi:MAG: DNA-binding response regulator [Candidatus Kapaibacterium sp.]|nr:MAG: DNA-binding response regulator [Candidatus Kapabacteria bacterium]
MIQAYLIDDERLARLEMRQALADFAGRVTVIGEAASKQEAVAYLASPQNPRPHVIFLDINMPNGSGFEVLEEIDYDGEEQIRIVFVTAYDEYALRAFKVNALDYLLKPIDPDRLEQTLMRLERGLSVAQKASFHGEEHPEGAMENQKSASEQTAAASLTSSKLTSGDMVFVVMGRTRRFVPLPEIVCIVASDNYSELHFADGKKAMLLRTMNEWEELLPEQDFLRIHRATIINLAYLDPSRPIEPSGSGAVVFLRDRAEAFSVSRRSFAKLKEQLVVK